MRRIITPVEFRDAFAHVVRERVPRYINQWRQHNDPAYTAFMRTEILPPIAESLSLRAWCEGDYNGLDAIFFEAGGHPTLCQRYPCEALNVVIEHGERKRQETYIEINKLRITTRR